MRHYYDIAPLERKILSCIKNRPGLYLGSCDLMALGHFMDAFELAAVAFDKTSHIMTPPGINEFTASYYNDSSSRDCFSMITCHEPDKETAFSKFFELLDCYLVRLGYEPLPEVSQDTNVHNLLFPEPLSHWCVFDVCIFIDFDRRSKLRKEYNSKEELAVNMFSGIDLSNPSKMVDLGDGFTALYYSDPADSDPVTAGQHIHGQIGELQKDGKTVFEWDNVYGSSGLASIIHHSDGNDYFLFSVDLYGYCVFNITGNKMGACRLITPYIYSDDNEESFIWAIPHYDKTTNIMAVEGCFWAYPYSVIVLDFSDPSWYMDPEKWVDLRDHLDPGYKKYSHIDFGKWTDQGLLVKAELVDSVSSEDILFSFEELKEMLKDKKPDNPFAN